MAIGTAFAPDTQVKKERQLAHAQMRSEARRAQRATEEENRRIAQELHDDFGLAPALESLATTFQLRMGTCCALDVAPELSFMELSSETSVALFRIAQELLVNVMRHAVPSQIHMQLHRSEGHVTLEVTDDGKGITCERMTKPDSFGLRGMQERASLLGGHFHIVGTLGVGTTARTSVPVAEAFGS